MMEDVSTIHKVQGSMTWRESIAWAAGFFDGEGHVCVGYKRTKSGRGVNYSPQLCIVQKRLEPLERLQAIYQMGTIGLRNRSGCYAWRVYGFERVQYLMATMWSWLSPHKREQFLQVFRTMYDYNQTIRNAHGVRVKYVGWKGPRPAFWKKPGRLYVKTNAE